MVDVRPSFKGGSVIGGEPDREAGIEWEMELRKAAGVEVPE